MKESVSKRIIMLIMICVLTALNIFMVSKQIVQAEEMDVYDANLLMEGALSKYTNYYVSDQDKGTLVQYDLRLHMQYGENSEFRQIKESEVTVNLNQIDGKYPYAVKVLTNASQLTNGKTDDAQADYEYNSQTGTLVVRVNNLNENGELINSNKPSDDAKDEYTLLCYYDTFTQEEPEREISYDISAKMALFEDDENVLTNSGHFSTKVTSNTDELTSINTKTDDIYNGYIKSNIINGTEYNTQYKDVKKLVISKKEAQQKVEIEETNTFVRVYQNSLGEEITQELGNNGELEYISTKIKKSDIVKILGEEGKVEIFDENGNILGTIDQNTEYAEDGTITITYEEGIKNIKIKTSNVINEGFLEIENVKQIKSNMTNVQNIKVKTTNKIIGINEEEQVEPAEQVEQEEQVEQNQEIIERQVYENTIENETELKDSQTNVRLELNNASWTNKQQNDVIFDIYLDSSSIQNNLFKNPTIKIELPEEVEKIILSNSSIVYGNGLELQEPYVETDENGRLSIIANLSGEQIQYDENNLGLMANIKISGTVILKKDIENTTKQINLIYTNAYTLNGQIEQGNVTKDIQIESYVEEKAPTVEEPNVDFVEAETVVPMNEQIEEAPENLESLKLEVAPTKGDVNLVSGNTVYEGEFIKYNIKVTNTSDADMEDVRVVASIPDGVTYGELVADYYSPFGEYDYKFDENLKEKEIEIGTLKAGESKTVYYEVKVNDLVDDEEKQIDTTIKSYLGNFEASNYEFNNVVKSAEVQAYLTANLDNAKDRWNYKLYLNSDQQGQVTAKVKFPAEFTLERIIYLGDAIDFSEDQISENNEITITLNAGEELYSFQGTIDSSKINKETENSEIELTAYATIEKGNNVYKSNENRIIYSYPSVNITMSSENEGEEVKYEDEINYEINVTNTGKTNLNNEGYDNVSVNIRDYLPENVNPVSVTYDKWEITEETIEETLEDGSTVSYMQSNMADEKTQITEDISSTSTDENGDKLPNVDISITIPYGETATISIKTTAGFVYEKTQVENSATVTGDEIDSKVSNTVTHIILPYDTTNSGGSDQPSNPEDPENPNNPEDPNNPSNPSEPIETYSISGVAWVDDNENGQRESTEEILSGITVMLVDTNNSGEVKERTQTNASGSYTFSDLDAGNYIVIFRYNTITYYITDYQKAGVSSTTNSDAISQEITLNGERISVGVTDTIALNASVLNIDLGLVRNKDFDLKLDKYISKVTVETNNGTKQYSYNNSKLSKIEIRAKEIEGAQVTVEYKIVVTNEGEATGTVGRIDEYIPEGFSLTSGTNTNWFLDRDGKVTNTSTSNQQIKSGESIELTLTVSKNMTSNDTGTYVNKAEIGESSGQRGVADIDSVPGNRNEQEDDISSAELIISISTGAVVYISIAIGSLMIIGLVIFLIKKFGLVNLSKVSLFIVALFIVLFAENKEIFAANLHQTAYYSYASGYTNSSRPNWPYTSTSMTLGKDGNYYYWSRWFTGGPTGNGSCINEGQNGGTGTYNYFGMDVAWTNTNTTKSSSPITLSKQPVNGSYAIGIKLLGDNYILGPISVSCSDYVGYSFEMYDSTGATISGYTTTDENGNFVWVGGTSTFYLRIPVSNCKKGISRLKITATKTITSTTTTTKYGRGKYSMGSAWQHVITEGNNIAFEQTSSSYTENSSDSVEWTSFNACLDIIKQDADDSDVKLEGVEVNVKNDSIGYDQTFTTDENGKIHIDNLPGGISYQITELSNNNYGYEKLESGAITLFGGITTQFSLTNEKQTGNLKIEKKDPDTQTALEGISFVIRKKTSIEEGVSISGKGDVDGDGFIDMSDLRIILRYVAGELEFTDEQIEEADLNDDAIVNIVDISLMMGIINSEYVVAMENIQTDQGEQLSAVSSVTGTIYLDGMTTTEDRSQATVFTTDADGLIQIYNILTGDYIIDEIAVGDNNYGYEIDDGYISWDNGTDTGEGATSIVTVERQRSYDTVENSKIIRDSQKIIDDGVYVVEAGTNSNMALDVNAIKPYNGTNIQIFEKNNSAAQKFYIRYLGNGYYKLTNIATNKNVDVNNLGTAQGTNVQLWEENYANGELTRAQQWLITSKGDGYYSLTARCNGLNLDIDNAGTTNGTNVQVWGQNSSPAQKFKFISLTTEVETEDFNTLTVYNRRKYVKLSGDVWEDIAWEVGKEEAANQLYQDIQDDAKDKKLTNVTVRLKDNQGNTIPFKDANGNIVQEILTDSDGKYLMQDVLIDKLADYYIEFTYNGMAYESVDIIDITKTNGTHAIEGNNRTEYNENYSRITYQGNQNNSVEANTSYSGQSNNSDNNKVYDIRYTTEDYKSMIDYEGEDNELYGYYFENEDEYANIYLTRDEYETYYPINGIADKYLISSTTYNAYRSVGETGYLSDIRTPEEIRTQGITLIDEGMDLGLKKRERPDISVVKDLKSASVSINNETHIYEYNDRFNTEAPYGNGYGYNIEDLDQKFNDLGVAFEEKYASMSYTRALYASDIKYEGTNQLEVKVTYKIGVRNNGTNINAKIYELQDYFDSKYELVNVGLDINDDGSIKEDTIIEGITASEYSENTAYNTMTISRQDEAEILSLAPQTEGYVYVELRVLPEHLIDIVNNGQEVKLDNITEVTSYGSTKTYLDENGNEVEEVYAGIDKDSQPGNLDVDDRTTWEDDTDRAPGLKIVLQDARTVSGQVFLDEALNQLESGKRTDEGEVRQGNGTLDNGESGIENVEVRLVNIDGSIAQVYDETAGDDGQGEFVDAIVQTNSDGSYTIEGFVPGYYVIEYTWGDQTYKVQDYKSTIVDEEDWNAKNSNDQWYKDEFKQDDNREWDTTINSEIRKSDAVDNYEQRLAIDGGEGAQTEITNADKQNIEQEYEEGTDTKITSTTPTFKISIEYDEESTNIRDEYQVDENGVLLVDENGNLIPKDEFKNNVRSIDFGIVERSRQALALEKHIKSAKITLADGNVIVNAELNDEGQLIDRTQYVTVIPTSATNGQVKIEIDQEIIQSATLSIEYNLKVTNISEVEYQTIEFYMYGEGYGDDDEDKLVTLQPALIIDYLDNNMATDMSQNTLWNNINKDTAKSQLIDTGLLSEELEDTIEGTSRIITTDTLKDTVLKPIGTDTEKSISVSLSGYKLLSNSDETFLENNAEIITVIKNNGGSSLITTPGDYVPNNSSTSEEDDSISESVTILPPTGLISDYIAYTILAITSLGILVVGIILIKRFV